MTLGEEILQDQLERAEDDKRELAKMIVALQEERAIDEQRVADLMTQVQETASQRNELMVALVRVCEWEHKDRMCELNERQGKVFEFARAAIEKVGADDTATMLPNV